MSRQNQLYIGLMSGTSVDAIDAALVELGDEPHLIASYSQPLSKQLREQIHAISLPGTNEIDRMGDLDNELGRRFAECVLGLIAKTGISATDVTAIGSHGQTIRHRPPGSQEGNFTLQIGNPNLIAELTGITTVADFRRRDMAAGGQGAPLVPAFHQAIFRSPEKSRIIINVGGMANITWLPTAGEVIGFDTGPGNVLMDLWIHEHLQQPYDKDGAWAATGEQIPELLTQLLSEPFFSQPFPKSTGREQFNRQWLMKHLQTLSRQVRPEDVQATLLQLTATSISKSIALLADVREVLLCGGGAFNKQLIQKMGDLLPDCNVTTTASYGIDPQWIEAMAFAWLAKQTMNRHTGNLRAVTGAKREVILGGVYYA